MNSRGPGTFGVSRRPVAGVLALALCVAVTSSRTSVGATLYWGAGSSDLGDPTALPTALSDLTGTWETAIRNWATDTNGVAHAAWSNAGATNAAWFGYGLTSIGVGDHGTVTLAGD